MKHTQGKWMVDTIIKTYIRDERGYGTGGGLRAICYSKFPHDNNEANAERIVSCVNALDGMNPEALNGFIEKVKVLLENLEMTQAELSVPNEVKNVVSALSTLQEVK